MPTWLITPRFALTLLAGLALASWWRGPRRWDRASNATPVPDEAVVEWLLPEGPFAYWKGRPVAITYE